MIVELTWTKKHRIYSPVSYANNCYNSIKENTCKGI